jgi:hypothetical protein
METHGFTFYIILVNWDFKIFQQLSLSFNQIIEIILLKCINYNTFYIF